MSPIRLRLGGGGKGRKVASAGCLVVFFGGCGSGLW